MSNAAMGGGGQQRQGFSLLTVERGLAINLNHIVWVEEDGASVTLYLSAPGPDGHNHVKITDPAVLNTLRSLRP